MYAYEGDCTHSIALELILIVHSFIQFMLVSL